MKHLNLKSIHTYDSTGWSIKTGPKTKFNNFSFNQPILKNKVVLES